MTPTRTPSDLVALLERIDGRGFKAYKELTGRWHFDDFTLDFDHVQGDPFADPSRVRVWIGSDAAGFPESAYRSQARALGTAALLATTFRGEAGGRSSRRGSGRSGLLRMESLGQLVLPQTATGIDEEGNVEARFAVGLPARGRRIAGREAIELLTEDVPTVVRGALMTTAYDGEYIERWAATNEDATVLREKVTDLGLVAFIADGARLPRRSGVDDHPLDDGLVIPFESPPSMAVEVDLPNAGTVTGMGIPEGVTLIVGGGFHGKSTVLRALQAGIDNHRPDDGRELVVSRRDTVKVRAEDGRSVAGVDISPFIDGLPMGRETTAFSSVNASGSTSQAAAIVEAWEAGVGALLVDEDTSATNFMIRDRRMQELVRGRGEPITPFIDRVRTLYRAHGISTVLVIGGSGDYLDVADRVVRMRDYKPEDVTAEARAVAEALPTGRRDESASALHRPTPRRPARDSIDASRRRRRVSVKVPDDRTLLFGEETVDISGVEQLPLRSQIRSVGLAMAMIPDAPDDVVSLPEILDWVEGRIRDEGLDVLSSWRLGTLAAFRRFELAAALNRLRSLRVTRA